MMLLGDYVPVLGNYPAADMDHNKLRHEARSVQAWQCFPEGSLSSVESTPIEDEESGTDGGLNGSPVSGQINRHGEETSTLRVKLMCSYGGRILPRPSDGKLRYVGGETRIVSVKRDVTYADLMQKLKQHYEQELSLKYQLPNEDLDALISVSNDEDLQNMMEEYDRLEGGDGLQRLRVFLFVNSDSDISSIEPIDPKKSEQWYVEAVNGLYETSSRKSGSGVLSARPSAENLVALEANSVHMDELLLSKKLEMLGGLNSAASSSTSPALVPQRHLGKLTDHPYAMYGSEGQQFGGVFNNSEFGASDLEHYYSARPDIIPTTDHDRIIRGYPTEAKMPRVGSHGKLTRLQDQHEDGPQDVLPRYLPQTHQHGEYRRPDYSLADGPYYQQPPVYHKEPYRAPEPYHQPHEEYFPGHLYQRSMSHVDSVGISPYPAPSSPRVALRHPQALHHQQLSMHRAYPANPMDHYGRRHDEPARAYRLSSSPPRYRDHHMDEQRSSYIPSQLPPQHHLPQEQMVPPLHHLSPEQMTKPPEMVPRASVSPLYGAGYQDNSPVYYQDSVQRGETRRPVQAASSQVGPRVEYDQLAQMEQLSLHGQSQHQHNQSQRPEIIDWSDKNLESDIRGRQQPDTNQTVESSLVFLDHQGSIPYILPGSNLGQSSQIGQSFPESKRYPESKTNYEHKWLGDDESTELLGDTDVGKAGNAPEVKPVHPVVNEVKAVHPVVNEVTAVNSLPDFPIFDKSGIFDPVRNAEVPTSGTVWKPDITSEVPGNTPHYMSETGHLAEDMASSVLRSRQGNIQNNAGNRSEEPAGNVQETPGNVSGILGKERAPDEKEGELEPQLTFTVKSWERELLRNGEENVHSCKEDNFDDALDKAESTVEKLPLDIALAAEQEAISRGLQIIKNSDLEEIRELGSGTYGTVYHGKWRGTDVAIKRIKASCFAGKPSERERLVADFWREACMLSQLHHPNVVAFYGVVPDGPGGTLATVTEYMVNGSLKQVLHKKDRTIDRRKRLLIAMDAAFGMEYLHGKNIVHFDLKCENLLVNMRDPHRPVCKVGDLGLSKVKRQTMVSGGVRGTLPWMAPELLSTTNSMVTDRVDVFSFGIVMWELLTGEEPYANMHYGTIIGGIVNNTLRPQIPSWCDPAWKSLMERCWAADPSARPSFSEIASELRATTSSLQAKA